MRRILFTIRNLLIYRKALRAILAKNSNNNCTSLLELTPKILTVRKIKVLVLDFDGVIAPHNAMHPLPSFKKWLVDLQNEWHGAIFILSNNDYPVRDVYFKTHFPAISFVKGMPRKPYPQGLVHIAASSGKLAHEILMVDDRLLTGILASLVAGTQSLWVTHPVQNFRLHFFEELWFSLLRWLDKTLVLLIR